MRRADNPRRSGLATWEMDFPAVCAMLYLP
jgi:hypothetical protein